MKEDNPYKTENHYRVVTKVQNGLGVLARVTILLRKFNINIRTLDINPIGDDEQFYNMEFVLDSNRNEKDFEIVMKKLNRLIPVVSLEYEKIDS